MPRLAQQSLAFTAKLIESLAPEAKRYRVADAKQRGLKIVVLPSGRKYWTVKYVPLDGREREDAGRMALSPDRASTRRCGPR